jgi:hypothetical protein
MSDLIKFLRQYPDTDYTSNDVITAYQGDEIIETYNNANAGIEDVLEKQNKGYAGQELIAEMFDGSYDLAFQSIREGI